MQTIDGRLGRYRLNLQQGQIQIWYQNEKLKTEMPLVSPRNAEREAARILGSFSFKKGHLAVVYSAAAVKVIESLEKSREPSTELIIFEADDLLAQTMRQLRPELFVNNVLITPKNIAKLPDLIELLDIEALSGYRIFTLPAAKKLDESFYEKSETLLKQTLASRYSDLFTRLEFEPLWILNNLAQLPMLHRAYTAASLIKVADKIQSSGLCAALVSTGPSLRRSLPWLKENQKALFIACVDSAYRTLHRAGITPHLIFTLDAQKFTARHFGLLPAGKKGEFPILYADLVANPGVTRNWQGELVYGLTAQYFDERRVVTPGSDFLENTFFENAEGAGDVQSGGSVATSLFDLLRQMNFSEIFFFGQDLAYTGYEIHSMGTHHSDMWLPTINRFSTLENINYSVVKRRETRLEASITGKVVAADYVLNLYRHWFENALQTLSGVNHIQVFNASADGLPISGARGISMADIASRLKGNPQQILGHLLKQKTINTRPEQIKEFLEKLSRFHSLDINDEKTEPRLATLIKEYPFLDKIGRRYRLQALRRGTDEKPQAQQSEQLMFLRMLGRQALIWLRQIKKTAE